MSDQQKYTLKLQGQKAVIIGGSSGIGYGVAEALLESGATVTISSSNPTRIESAVQQLKSSYPSKAQNVSGQVCNLGDENTAEDNIKSLFLAVGKLDHVIITAADKLATLPLSELDIPKMHQAGLMRFFVPLLIAKHAVHSLNPGPRSSITFTTGSVAERPLPQWSLIGSYATAILGMTRGLALDIAPIRVNAVAPGVVDTNLWTEEQRKAVFPALEKSLPVGRVGRVEDVAEAFVYLIRDGNVTGSCVNSNGGQLLV